MPDMFAHYLVAESAARRVDTGGLLAGAYDAFKVGAQGPDVFFYSRLVRGRRGRPNLSRLAHQHQMAAAFRSMLARAAASPAGERGAAFALRRRLRRAPVSRRGGPSVGALLDGGHHRRS